MDMIDVASMTPVRENLVIVGELAFYCDAYIVMPDGILLGSRNPKDPDLVIMTKIDNTGAIITEFNSGTTWDEFIELRDEMVDAMQEHVHSCGCDPEDEDGQDIIDEEFKTELKDLRDYV